MRPLLTVLDAEPDGMAERTAERAGDHPRTAVTGGVLLVGYVALTVLLSGVGVLVTHVLLDRGVGSLDHNITVWLADHRTPPVNQVTRYATFVANTEPVVAAAGIATVWLLLRHRWREVIFLMGGLALELTVFLSVNLLIDRPRPDVPRLNSTPTTSSFPSGHAAASIVLWVGIALVVGVVTTSVVARVVAWLPVVILPPTIAFARVYRGMHNPTDVLAGVLLGAMSIGVACFAARVWTAATARRLTAADVHDQAQLSPAGVR